jgi:hypothetical protein
MRLRRLPKVGSRNGDWILKGRRRNPDGTFTDKWVYDPVATIQGYPTDTLYCTSEATGYGDSTNGYIWKKKTTVVGSENSATSIKTGKAAAGTYFGFYCGCTDNAVTGLPASFANGRGWRIETGKEYPSVGVVDIKIRLLNRAAYAHSGKVCAKLFKGTSPDGTGLTALTDWVESPNTISFSATSEEVKTDSFTITFSPAISIASNEYVYVQFAWKVTTAATNANAGVKLAVNTTTPTAVLIPSTTNKAYKYSASNATSAITNAGVATTEFTATEYTNVSSDNAVYVATSASVSLSGRYANVAHRFTFDLSAYTNITQIEYRWDGYASETSGKVQHKETSGWVTDFTTTPTSDGAGFERTKALTNISDIVISNVFEFGLYMSVGYFGEPYSIYLYSDYVEIEVTYGVVVKKPIGDGLTFALI